MSVVRSIRRREALVGAGWPAQVTPLLRRIYAARGAHDEASAQPRLAQLLPPDALSGIDDAVAMLADAIARDAHIMVVGDFDCDGATACAVAVRGLRMLGAMRVSHAVPNRMVHGYGLSPLLVQELAPLRPDLLLTVDHGIACHAGIAAAKAQGWRVLVTDHHLPGEQLPPADAIVNPNQRGDGFACKSLAGVGVIFYVLLALRRHLRALAPAATGDSHEARVPHAAASADLTRLLDLVAVGTIADLVMLDTTNRSLVAAGLRQLREGRGCAGLQALITVAGRDPARLTASDIGFAVAPRLNAAGRLEDMALGIHCLLTDEPAEAHVLAARLHAINAERRGVQQAMVDEAEAALALRVVPTPDDAAGVCLFDPDWHPGVIGLVASRLKERLHRPVVAFAPAEPGSVTLRGSARSIPGFHVRDALAVVDSLHPGLIDRFGGHAMAAGLSLPRERLAEFEAAFDACTRATLPVGLLAAEIASDGALHVDEFDHAHACALRDGGPWGQGFPEPQFDGEFDVIAWRVVGERHLKLELGQPGLRLNAIEFGGWAGEPPPPRVRVVYRLEADLYRGGSAVQLVVVHREHAPDAVPCRPA